MSVPTFAPAAEASFVAYVHYLEDLADVIAGRYGAGIGGIHDSMRLHPPVLTLAPRDPEAAGVAALNIHLQTAWNRLAAVDNAVASNSRQANAVVPHLAFEAVVATGHALAVALAAADVERDDDVLAFLADAVADELFPYPWSALCHGCPQIGQTVWGGSVLPGEGVSVLSMPRAATSDARVALLLRTTRERIVEREFAVARRTDVRPGRSRRNLTREHKELIAAGIPPTTLFDVFDRVRRRVGEDDGAAFVDAPHDDVEAVRLTWALASVTDASVAVIEAVTTAVVGEGLYADLLASHVRRAPSSGPARRRLEAAW